MPAVAETQTDALLLSHADSRSFEPNNQEPEPQVSSSGRGVIGTEYLRHTDAGAVRVVELPPSYNDLEFRPARQGR
jgi:hypothetical protein